MVLERSVLAIVLMYSIKDSDIEKFKSFPPNESVFYNVCKYRSRNPIKRMVFEQYLKNMIKFAADTKNIVDVGCGEGVLLYLADKLGERDKLVGIDLSQESLDVAKKIVDAEFYCGDIRDLSFLEDSEFDIAFCLSVFEHIDKHELVVREMARVSQKSVITIPHPLLFRIVSILSFRNWTRLGREHNHLKEFTIEELKKILPKNAIVERRGFWIVGIF